MSSGGAPGANSQSRFKGDLLHNSNLTQNRVGVLARGGLPGLIGSLESIKIFSKVFSGSEHTSEACWQHSGAISE